MANDTDINNILKELNATAKELKTKFKGELNKKMNSAYDEVAATSIYDIDANKQTRFKPSDDALSESMLLNGRKKNKNLTNEEKLRSIEQYNKIMDQAISELAASIDGRGKKVINHIKSNTTKEQDRERWARKKYKQSNIKKSLEDLVTEYIDDDVDVNHMLNPNDTLEDLRYSVLEKLSDEHNVGHNYESWDLSESFIREELVKNDSGTYTSDFIADDIMDELTNISRLSEEQYTEYKNKAVSQITSKAKEKSEIERLINPNTRTETDSLVYEEMFNKYLERKKIAHSELVSKHQDAVKSLRINKKKVSRANNKINKTKELAKMQLEILNAAQDMERGKNAINYEEEKSRINEMISKSNDGKLKVINDVNRDKEISDKLKQDIENSDKFLADSVDNQKDVFNRSLQLEIDTIDNSIKNLKNDDKKMAERISKNVNNFWNNNEIKFKELTKEQFDKALENYPDDTKKVLQGIYEFDDVTNTYKKRPYLLWSSDEGLGLNGVTDITTDPHEIVNHFNLSNKANTVMEDYYIGSVETNKKNAILSEIADKLREVKKQQSDIPLDEKIAIFKELNESLNNPVEIQNQVESETGYKSHTTYGKDKIVTAIGEAEQFKWVTEEESALIGDKAISQLRGTRLGEELFDLSVRNNNKADDIVNLNREYINILNKASSMEELDFSKSRIKDGLESIDVLNKINNLFDIGSAESIAEAKQSLASYSNNGSYSASNRIEYEMRKLGLYGKVEDVSDINSLKSVVNSTIETVVGVLDGYDWDLISVIDSKIGYKEKPDVVAHLQESLSENRQNKIEFDRDYNGGSTSSTEIHLNDNNDDRLVRATNSQYDGEDIAWFDETHKYAYEYDATIRDFTLRDVALEQTKDEEVSIIQKRQAEFINQYIKKTNIPVRLRNLGEDFTLKELEQGLVSTVVDNNSDPVPVQHFSEFYSLMSLNKLDPSRDKATPFTSEEWGGIIQIDDSSSAYSNGSGFVKIGNNEIPIRQFYEYYNHDVRKAQNDKIRAKIDESNNNTISQMEEHKISMRERTEKLNLDMLSNKLNRKNNVNKQILEFLSKTPELEEYKLSGRALERNGLISSIEIKVPGQVNNRLLRPSADNFKEILDLFNIDIENVPTELIRNVESVSGFDYHKELKKSLELSDIEVEKQYSSRMITADISDELSNNDIETFYKYKQNDYLAATKEDRIMYIPKGADPSVVKVLNDAKKNPNNKAVHFRGDVLNYDVLEIGTDGFKIRPTDWIEANKTRFSFKFSDDFIETMNKANKLQDEMKGYNNKTKSDFISTKNALKDGKLIINDKVYSRMDLYNKMTQKMDYINMEILSSSYDIINKEIPIQRAALKVINTNFTWMRKDPMMVGSLAADAEMAVIEAISEVTNVEVNDKFNLRKGAIADGSKNIIDVVEESISNRLKGKLLNNYITVAGGGDTGNAVIRGAKIALEADNTPVNVETVSDFLRTITSSIKDNGELSKYYSDIEKILNDKYYLKQAIETDITNIIPIQSVSDKPNVDFLENSDNDKVNALYRNSSLDSYSVVDDYTHKNPKYTDANTISNALEESRIELSKQEITDRYNINHINLFTVIKDKYTKRKATNIVNTGIEATKKNGKIDTGYEFVDRSLSRTRFKKGNKSVSKTMRKMLIEEVKEAELKKLNTSLREASIESGLKTSSLMTILDHMEKEAPGTYDDVKQFIAKNPALEPLRKNLIKGEKIDVISIYNDLRNEVDRLQEEDFGIRLQSVKKYIDENGADSLIQYINDISDDDNPFGGISKLFSNEEIFAESQNIDITNIEQYKNLSFLSELVPGFDIEVTGQTANGQRVTFNINDSKPNYEGGNGLVVKDRSSGKWLPIVDTSPITNKPVGLEEIRSLSSIEASNIDTVKKSEMFKIEDVPILINADDKLKTTIAPNLNFDFDKLANTNNGYGKLSPVQSLVNTSKLLKTADSGFSRGSTLDFETTGLPDKLGDAGVGHFFQPIQATIETFDLAHGDSKNEIVNRSLTNYYLAPDDALVTHMEELYGDTVVDTLKDNLDSNDTHLLKNYAKYSMPDAAYKTKVITNEDGIDKIHFEQEVTGSDGKKTQQFVESKYTPEEYVKELQSNAENVVNFLRSGGETGDRTPLIHEGKFYQRDIKDVPSIDLNNGYIYDNKADFLQDIISDTSDSNAVIGHNLSGADIPWAKRWIKESIDDLNSEIDIAKLEGDKTSMGIAKRFIKELEKPFLTNAIDTMHLGKLLESGEPKFNLIDSANRNDITVDGLAHLSDVDVPKTTDLFVNYTNKDGMKSIMNGINDSVELGNIIVKSSKSSDGLQLDRGIYKVADINENPSGGIDLNLLDLANENNEVKINVDSMAVLQRDAMETWTKFEEHDLDIAMKLHNSLESVESNRTMKNAITNLDTWMLHKQTGQDNGYGKMLDTFNGLKVKYDALETKANDNLKTETVTMNGVEVPSMSYQSYTDEEKFLYENRNKFQGAGYVKELNRLSEEVPQRRISSNKAELEYMNSDEGKMVEHFLTESQNRLDAGVIDESAFKQFNNSMRQTIHDVKLEAFQNGKMNDAMITAPKKYNLGEINVDVLEKLGGSSHGFGGDKSHSIEPFDFTLDFTNYNTLYNSIQNTTGKIAKNMHFNNEVATMEEGRKVALNRFVMPLIQEKGLLPTDGDWAHITNIAKNIVAIDSDKVDIPTSMTNTLPVAVDYMMNNKRTVTSKLAPLQEVNMMKGSNGEILNNISNKISSNLDKLDKEAATRPVGTDLVHSPELQAVHNELTNIARINRQDAVSATGGNYMPFYNYQIGSERAVAHIESLPNASEFNLKNPVSAELGMQTAEQIKTKADELQTDRRLVRPYEFRAEAIHGNANRVASAMPEYMDILKKDYGYNEDHISEINHDIANDLEKRAYKPLYNNQVQAKAQKAQMYRELSRRASASSRYNVHNADVRQLDLENADRTKFNAMLQLGWAQRYQDANGTNKIRAGRVGLPNQAPTSQSLDPSKVLITSGANVGSLGPNGAIGLSYTDLSLKQLKTIGENRYTPNREKIMIGEYLKQDGIENIHTDMMAKQNIQNTIARKRAQQLQANGMPESMVGAQDYIGNANANTIANGGSRKPPIKTPKPITQSTVDDVIPASHFTEASREIRQTINDVGSEARGVVREIMNSNSMKVAGIGIAFAGALALTRKPYTSDGGTKDQKATGDNAPRVDGTYAPEYNGSKHNNIPLPKQQKSVRVEENGTGMNVRVRAKNKGNIPDGDVTNAVSNAVNSTVKTDINIHQTDDRQSIDKGYVSNLFSQLLGGQ